MAHKFSDPVDGEIIRVHRRYLEVMEEERLITMSDATKESYLKFLILLTGKLEKPGKPLSEIVRELLTEAGPLIFEAMQR